MITWIMVAIGIFVILLLIMFVYLKGKKKVPMDYYALFNMGIIWLILGIPLRNFFMSGIGAVFMAVALTNKDKWKKNTRTWKKMSKEEQNMLMITLGTGLVLLIAVAIIFLIR